MKAIFSTLSFMAILAAGAPAFAAPVCNVIHQTTPKAVSLERQALAQELIARKIPAVAIPTRNGPLPVILFNVQTEPALRPFLNDSLGTIVNYQPEHRNDHGLLRLFSIVADIDTPGARRTGEIHQTGISWVRLQDLLQYSQGRSRVKVEVAYRLTAPELLTATLYHLMRRAAILRVPFTFGGAPVQKGLLNQLENLNENCFTFCQSSRLSSQVEEIRKKFQTYNIGSVEEVSARADVRQWIDQVEDQLISVKNDDPQALGPYLPLKTGVPASLRSALLTMNEPARAEFLNWIFAFVVTQRYSELIQTLGISGDTGFSAIHNPRATAVLIYDGQSTAEQFASKDYVKPGVFSTWVHKDTEPLSSAFQK